MSWTTPAFEEIKMDAEAKSYSDGLAADEARTPAAER